MTERPQSQLSAEQQQETPLFVCSECGETVIIFNGKKFQTCYCDPMQVILTEEGIRRDVSIPN